MRCLKSGARYMLLPLTAVVFASAAYGNDYDKKKDEGKTMVFKITKPTTDGGYDYPERVRYSYAVNEGSAKSGEDYRVVRGTTGKIVFPKGPATTAAIKIKLIDDGVDEGDGETLELVLTSPQHEIVRNVWLYAFYLPTKLTFSGLIRDPD